MTPIQRKFKTMTQDGLEYNLSEIMGITQYEIDKLDPNVSGQDDEINQLEKIQKHLNEAHSELLTYIKKY